MMILSSLKTVSVATLGAMTFALGLGGAAFAESASITATTSGLDSGFDSIAQEVSEDENLQYFFDLLVTRFGDDVTLREILSDPVIVTILADPEAAVAGIDRTGLAPDWAPVVDALENSDLLLALAILDLPTALNGSTASPSMILDTPIIMALEDEVPDDFFRVSFDSGPVDAYIQSITFDLGVDLDADFDHTSFTFDASPKVGQLSGLQLSDISFSPVTSSAFDSDEITTQLTVSFAPGSFGFGDFFTFGVDTNEIGDDSIDELAVFNTIANHNMPGFNDSGADFGRAGVKFSVVLENGESGQGTFQTVGPMTSQAQVALNWAEDEPTAVPEPGMFVGLLGVAAIARQRKQRRAS